MRCDTSNLRTISWKTKTRSWKFKSSRSHRHISKNKPRWRRWWAASKCFLRALMKPKGFWIARSNHKCKIDTKSCSKPSKIRRMWSRNTANTRSVWARTYVTCPKSFETPDLSSTWPRNSSIGCTKRGVHRLRSRNRALLWPKRSLREPARTQPKSRIKSSILSRLNWS